MRAQGLKETLAPVFMTGDDYNVVGPGMTVDAFDQLTLVQGEPSPQSTTPEPPAQPALQPAQVERLRSLPRGD
jgi:hypothetical protein